MFNLRSHFRPDHIMKCVFGTLPGVVVKMIFGHMINAMSSLFLFRKKKSPEMLQLLFILLIKIHSFFICGWCYSSIILVSQRLFWHQIITRFLQINLQKGHEYDSMFSLQDFVFCLLAYNFHLFLVFFLFPGTFLGIDRKWIKYTNLSVVTWKEIIVFWYPYQANILSFFPLMSLVSFLSLHRTAILDTFLHKLQSCPTACEMDCWGAESINRIPPTLFST